MYTIAVIGFLLFVLIWTSVYLFLDDKAYIQRAAIQSYQTVVLWGALFFCGRFIPEDMRLLRKLFLMFVLIVFVSVLIYVAVTGRVFFVARRYFDTEGGIASYQGFARSMMITAFLVLPVFLRRHVLLILFSIMVIFLLFVLSARSEFIGFVVGLSIILFAMSVKDARYLGIIIIGIISFTISLFLLYEYGVSSRILELINIESSSSWQARQIVFDRALMHIHDSPIIGYFGGHAITGGTASYAHNVFSAYVNYGLLGFIWYLMLSIIPIIVSLRRVMLRIGPLEEWSVVLGLAVANLLLILAAKSVFWPVPALVWGLYARIKSR